MVNIPDFTHVGNYRKDKKGGGVSILIRNSISFKHRTDLDVFEEGQTESIFVEILNKNGQKIVLGSLYRPPNTGIEQFHTHLVDIITKAKKNRGGSKPEMVLGMDHNIDLLKSSHHPQTHSFIDELSWLDILPMITRPSRITSHSANIYVSEQLHRQFESGLLMSDISDHLPTLVMLKQTRLLNKEPLTFKSRCLNDDKLKSVNHKLMGKDWTGLLTGTTCDEKFNRFSDIVNAVLDETAPMKTVKILAKRCYVEPWMTKGLESASKTKLPLYKDSLKSNSTENDVQCYKHRRNLYNQLKRKLRTDYYRLKCESYKSNAKKLWSLINQMITKVKHKGSIIPFITVDGIKYNKPKTIADKFGEFYSQLGSTLAKSIVPGTTSIEHYIENIPSRLIA